MNELLVRTLSGVALMAVALIAAFYGGYLFALLVAAAATLMFYEWSRIVRNWSWRWKVAGFFYALVPALALLWIRERADVAKFVPILLVWTMIVTWSTDIGAYFAGRKFGRTKLAPSISPNKTVEGLYGGMALATLLGGGWVLLVGLSHLLIVVAPVFAAIAQGGDLFESWMKRKAGVKDSGNWLPGHGGMLDRLDGMVPVAVLTAALHIAGLV
ncbi:MAG: phosphatidate cytidylyltransferase [Sphingomicrobium sp.]